MNSELAFNTRLLSSPACPVLFSEVVASLPLDDTPSTKSPLPWLTPADAEAAVGRLAETVTTGT